MLLLPAFAIILLAIIFNQSCSKSSSPSSPTTPTVSAVTSGAIDTAGKTSTLTITGTNLTGASVTTTAAGITISNISVATGGTSLTATITVASDASAGSVTLTITTSAGSTTTTIAVAFTSDSVEAQALVAYWNFDNQSNETISGTAAYSKGVTYTTGIRGEAYQGAAGAYDTLPATAALEELFYFLLVSIACADRK